VAEDGVVGGVDGLGEAGVGVVGGVGTSGKLEAVLRKFRAVCSMLKAVRSMLKAVWRGMGRDAALGPRGGLAESVQEGFAGEMAGDLAAGGPAHAVADHEDAVLGQGGACVLVGMAHASAMGEHGEEARRRRDADSRDRGADLRLGRFQSRGIRHFGTQDAPISGSLRQYSSQRWRPILLRGRSGSGIVWRQGMGAR
jgi:hypothetical protein